jgi:hypothetical protein
MKVTRAIIMFGGFQESEARQSGFERGFFAVVRQFAGPETTVYHPRTWKTNTSNLLRQLYENGITTVAILSYSHGQAAAMDFARQAPKYGVTIELYMANDPVYRPTWSPRSTWAQVFSIRSIIGNPTIKVPPSVRHVYSVIQTLTLPNGHRFVAEDPSSTTIHAPIEIKLPHTRIDESPDWWSLVENQLNYFVPWTTKR